MVRRNDLDAYIANYKINIFRRYIYITVYNVHSMQTIE